MKRKARLFIYPVLCMVLLFSLTSAVYADLEDVKQATVSIECICGTGDNAMISSGSGFLVSADGFVVTNAHVIISNNISVDVKIGGRTHSVGAKLCYLDDVIDVAILKIQLGGLDYLEMGDDTQLKLGERLFAVGSPLVFTDIFTDGIYSAYNEELGMLQHTAELSHGNSGGPLVTEEGVVMGVNTIVVAFPGESRYYFAIPITLVQAVLESVQYQDTIEELIVYCDERLGPVDTEVPVEPYEPSDPYVPSEPYEPDSTYVPADTYITVDPDMVNYYIDIYPEGWMTYSSSYYHYSFDLPDFFSYEFSSDEDFMYDGMEFFGSYDDYADPYFASVPIIMLYIGFPETESFYDFKQRIGSVFEDEGFIRDTSFEMENIITSQPGLEFDAYWYDGSAGSDYSSLSRATYFVRDKSIDNAFYAFDFTFNNLMGDDLDVITIPLMIQILWTFNTGG